MRILAIILTVFLATPVLAEATVAQVTVVGEGKSETAPDMATISLGVLSQGKTAAEVMRQNNAAVANVLEEIRSGGVAARDMQTSGLSLSPVWDNRSSISGEERIKGFQASNMVTVRVRDLDRLGEILDRVVGAGANRFNGLQFGVQKIQPLADAARQAAVKDAMRKAELYAQAAGVRLGRVLTISENGGGAMPRPEMMRSAAAMDGMSVPLAEGEVSVRASVTMVFALSANEQ